MSQVYTIWIPVVAMALVMASFSMPVSLLILLSHNILGHKEHEAKLALFSWLYLLGAILAMLIVILFAIAVASIPSIANDQRFAWSLYALLIIDGLFVLLFYYRSDRGTRIWLPRKTAVNLTKSVEEVRGPGSAFLSGGLSVFAELLLTIVPIFVAAEGFAKMSQSTIFVSILGYLILALLPVIILIFANSSGHKISRFQRFREHNKSFFQVAAGVMMIILGIYLFVVKG